MKKALYLLFALLAFAACSVDIPSDIISEGRMEDILYDYHMAQGMAESNSDNREAERYRLVQLVFQKYHVTEAEFDSSMVWYSGHSEHLLAIYERIQNRMEKRSALLGMDAVETTSFDRYSELGDTAVAWRKRMLCVLPSGNDYTKIYTLHADTTFHVGDIIQLDFSSRFVTAKRHSEGYALLVATYDNDSICGTTACVSADYDSHMTLLCPSYAKDARLRTITIMFYQEPSSEFCAWLIRKPCLLRIHDKEAEHKTDIVDVDTLQTDTLKEQVDTLMQQGENGSETHETVSSLNSLVQKHRPTTPKIITK